MVALACCSVKQRDSATMTIAGECGTSKQMNYPRVLQCIDATVEGTVEFVEEFGFEEGVRKLLLQEFVVGL